ncbi:Crp/Fnr family transcriptional regulator [Saccharopolyspora sp. NFXS83]|uniref:Crp/Fnr family transcriptional regulator n=1 Tax=Saccharopolyspora sp. NFXS83 TaxID=2993560 RepID=UPI00224B3AD5|nr:Crp/Fnr family transcriptional regulator [Saccharopolyspora sp. NFXS83]MCX2729632.1 Crp/Fnr family transcriptional regulator [Saccharopolyspora sp. NFXS83]
MSSPRASDGERLLQGAGALLAFHRDDRLMTAGEPATDVLLIGQGLVKIVLPDAEGGQPVAGVSGPGDLLGEMGAVHARPRTASVVALSAGHAWRVSAEVFRDMQDRAAVRDLLNETWRKRQENFDDRQVAQSRGVLTRVAVHLLKWAEHFGRPTGSGRRVDGLTQLDIAGVVAASPKQVESALSQLRQARLISTGRRTFTVLDAPGVRDLIRGNRGGDH